MSVRISSQASHSTNPVLTLRDISKSYNGIGALIDSNIEVLPGDAIGLIGQNGAGKSTLIKIISGSEAPSSGSIVVEKAIQKAAIAEKFAERAFTVANAASLGGGCAPHRQCQGCKGVY
jgi:ABC-type sugar transport system ATPase subunit